LYGKTTAKENLAEKLKEIGGIKVWEDVADFFPTMICRKCFRKTIGLTKALYIFRTICLQSKKIKHEGMRKR